MSTITEDYVSLEVAKLLKDKGFDEPVSTCYSNYNGLKPYTLINTGVYSYKNSTEHAPFWISAPTLQMAMKWLRIKHNIHIEPHIVKTKYSYGYMPNYIDLKELKQHFPFDEFDFSNADEYVCITHDKACEVTIKYCLEKLI